MYLVSFLILEEKQTNCHSRVYSGLHYSSSAPEFGGHLLKFTQPIPVKWYTIWRSVQKRRARRLQTADRTDWFFSFVALDKPRPPIWNTCCRTERNHWEKSEKWRLQADIGFNGICGDSGYLRKDTRPKRCRSLPKRNKKKSLPQARLFEPNKLAWEPSLRFDPRFA